MLTAYIRPGKLSGFVARLDKVLGASVVSYSPEGHCSLVSMGWGDNPRQAADDLLNRVEKYQPDLLGNAKTELDAALVQAGATS